MDTHIIYIGLGSNLGDGQQNLDSAIRFLQAEVGELLYTSAFMISEPWGFVSQHVFTNAVAVFRTALAPFTLLDVTQRIERQMGRIHKRKAGEGYRDRIIDIDLLIYDDVRIETERLTLPHPHIADRDFVRLPLTECQQYMQGLSTAGTNTRQ